MGWTVETLNETVDAEVEALAEDMRARLARSPCSSRRRAWSTWASRTSSISRAVFWEMRLSGRSGISRALYVTALGKRVVIVRVFVKKTQKTPWREIELARSRAKSVK
ncbi:MAG: type II toxin-antitoxin system RelE/ParE family toxin [Bryobacteraceae bacterium]|nr:type II toxin-antitoxin system RelE/ParE family toxin [Bryobacteraceae bacterium]